MTSNEITAGVIVAFVLCGGPVLLAAGMAWALGAVTDNKPKPD